jgi:hypothetical protein
MHLTVVLGLVTVCVLPVQCTLFSEKEFLEKQRMKRQDSNLTEQERKGRFSNSSFAHDYF